MLFGGWYVMGTNGSGEGGFSFPGLRVSLTRAHGVPPDRLLYQCLVRFGAHFSFACNARVRVQSIRNLPGLATPTGSLLIA